MVSNFRGVASGIDAVGEVGAVALLPASLCGLGVYAVTADAQRQVTMSVNFSFLGMSHPARPATGAEGCGNGWEEVSQYL